MATTRRDKMCDDDYRIVDDEPQQRIISADAIGVGVGSNLLGERSAIITVDINGARIVAPIPKEELEKFCSALRKAVHDAESDESEDDNSPSMDDVEALLKAIAEMKKRKE